MEGDDFFIPTTLSVPIFNKKHHWTQALEGLKLWVG